MKLLRIVFLFAFFIACSQTAITQPPPPSEHGRNNDQPVPAPIGGGLAILAGLGIAYGAAKVVGGREGKR